MPHHETLPPAWRKAPSATKGRGRSGDWLKDIRAGRYLLWNRDGTCAGVEVYTVSDDTKRR